MKRKLLYLHQYFNLPVGPGGTRSWEFSRRLVRDGWDVVMITSSRSEELHAAWYKYLDEQLKDEPGSFKLILVDAPYSNEMSFARRILAFLQYALKSAWITLKEPDVKLVFATSTPLTIAIPAMIRKWLRGTPYVFEVRDLWPEMPIAVGALKSPVTRFLARTLEKMSYKNARRVVGLSPGMCQGIVDAGFPEDKVHEIPNSSDIDRFEVPAEVGEDFRREHPEFADRPLVVYAGTFGIINKVGYMVKLAKAMEALDPSICFLAVGEGAEFEPVRELAEKEGVAGKNFFQWPILAKEKIPALMSACTVSAVLFAPVPEMEKNSSNKFFDSLAAGRPVALNYGGWMKSLVESEGAGIHLDPSDTTKAAQALMEFIQDKERLAAAGMAAERLAKERFDRELLYQKLRGVLEQEYKSAA